MKDLTFKNRHRLSKKEIKHLENELRERYGITTNLDYQNTEIGYGDEYNVIIENNLIVAIVKNQEIMLTVRGILQMKPVKRYIIVDQNAVLPICNGANVMSPGIVDADTEIKKNDFAYVLDVLNRNPIAVGIAQIDGTEMVKKQPGIALKNLHHIGDLLWKTRV